VPIHLPARKSRTASARIMAFRWAFEQVGEIIVPLTCRADLPVEPAVQTGRIVKPFGRLSRAVTPDGGEAHCPFQAEVAEFVTVDTAEACDLPAVKLRILPPKEGQASPLSRLVLDVGGDDLEAVLQEARQRQERPSAEGRVNESLPDRLDRLGLVAAYAGRPEPLGALLRRAAGRTDLLVVNAIQSEPYLATHHRLLTEGSGAVVAGIQIIGDHLDVGQVILLVDAARKAHPDLAGRLAPFGIDVVPVRTGYPGDAEPILLRRLFDRRVPAGGCGLDVGCLVLGADAVWQAGISTVLDVPVVTRPLTLAGDCLAPQMRRVVSVPIGLRLADLLRLLRENEYLLREPRVVILGGPMTGTAVADLGRTVISKTTQAVLLMSHAPPADTTGCIRCGWCIDGCPVDIDPIAVLEAVESSLSEIDPRLRVERCIDCGICTYVCPSHLPLAQAVQTAKALHSH